MRREQFSRLAMLLDHEKVKRFLANWKMKKSGNTFFNVQEFFLEIELSSQLNRNCCEIGEASESENKQPKTFEASREKLKKNAII